jgi:hypothetical protein
MLGDLRIVTDAHEQIVDHPPGTAHEDKQILLPAHA